MDTNATQTRRAARPARSAYTLVELLAVMAIMAILLAATLPMIAGLNESNNINQAGNLFADQVGLARQIASARNETVEVRCINDTNLSPTGFSAIQLWATSAGVPVSRLQKLPDGIVIAQNTTAVSTLFNYYYITNAMPSGNLTGCGYLSFTVSPSGLVGPLSATAAGNVVPDMANLVVAIVPKRFATQATLPPKNYMLVQLNPMTAATVTFRP